MKKKHGLPHWGVLSHGTAHPGIESCRCYWFNIVKPMQCLVQHRKQNYHSISDADYYIITTLRLLLRVFSAIWGFPGSSDSKESACNAGDRGLIPGTGRTPGEGYFPSILAWGSPWTERSLAGYSPWSSKELEMT